MGQHASSQKNGKSEAAQAEPIGIVISSGKLPVEAPMFAAYVWGPVPGGDIAEDCVAVA